MLTNAPYQKGKAARKHFHVVFLKLQRFSLQESAAGSAIPGSAELQSVCWRFCARLHRTGPDSSVSYTHKQEVEGGEEDSGR